MPTATHPGDFLHFGAQVQTAAGDAGDAEALEIAQAMARLVGSACSAADSPVAAQLAVSRVVHWELHIDAVVMECGGGNVFDAVALATRAALAATKLPLLDIVEGEVPGTYDVELASDVTKLAPEHAPRVCITHSLLFLAVALVFDVGHTHTRVHRTRTTRTCARWRTARCWCRLTRRRCRCA